MYVHRHSKGKTTNPTEGFGGEDIWVCRGALVHVHKKKHASDRVHNKSNGYVDIIIRTAVIMGEDEAEGEH